MASMLQGARTFFSEIISSISDLRFTRDGRFLVSRDYMTLKLWDIRMETGPVSTHNVHENLRSRVRPTAWHGLVHDQCWLPTCRSSRDESGEHCPSR